MEEALPFSGAQATSASAAETMHTHKLEHFAEKVLTSIESISLEIADVAGTIDALTRFALAQEQHFSEARVLAKKMLSAVKSIHDMGTQTSDATLNASHEMENSSTTVGDAIRDVEALVSCIQSMEQRLNELHYSVEAVTGMSQHIGGIALQTNMLSLNAAIEAARAGELGRGFAVVASEVKTLASQTSSATSQIDSAMKDLSSNVDNLADSSSGAITTATTVNSGIGIIQNAVTGFSHAIYHVSNHAVGIKEASSECYDECHQYIHDIEEVIDGLSQTNSDLQSAHQRITSILKNSEALIEFIADTDIPTHDSPFIELVIDTANTISRLFEKALDEGEITHAELFSDQYAPIANTDPQQHMTPFVSFTDRVLPALQEPILTFSDKVVFCAAVDVRGFLPTHNQIFSKPQGNDPVWNNANCRNRRIFNDKTGLSAGQSTKRFLLQTYRRDYGGGRFVMMKDLSAPIWVNGKHWGGFRMGYKL